MSRTDRNAQKKQNSTLSYALVLLFSILFIVFGTFLTDNHLNYTDEDLCPIRTEVVNVLSDNTVTSINDLGDEVKNGQVIFEALIKSGEHKGETVQAIQTFDEYMTIIPRQVSVGDKVIIYASSGYDYGIDYIFTEYIRSDALLGLTIVFCLLLVGFGKKQGFNTLISLAFTCLAIFQVFIPAVLSGYNVYLWSIITCIYTTIMTVLLVSGIGRKSVVAILGCLGGVFCAGALMLFMHSIIHLTGTTCEDALYLKTSIPGVHLDLVAICFAGIIIGAMGAVMDVSMSIASSLWELKMQTPSLSVRQMLSSGVTISRDIMGTMANTLILAYIGSCLPSALLLFSYYSSIPFELFNMEMIVSQILQALVGSMGILLTLPLSTVLGAWFYRHSKPANCEYTPTVSKEV